MTSIVHVEVEQVDIAGLELPKAIFDRQNETLLVVTLIVDLSHIAYIKLVVIGEWMHVNIISSEDRP